MLNFRQLQIKAPTTTYRLALLLATALNIYEKTINGGIGQKWWWCRTTYSCRRKALASNWAIPGLYPAKTDILMPAKLWWIAYHCTAIQKSYKSLLCDCILVPSVQWDDASLACRLQWLCWLHYTITVELHCTLLHTTSLHCITMHLTFINALNGIALYCIVLYCTVLYCTAQNCSVLFYPISAIHCSAAHLTSLHGSNQPFYPL